MTHSILDLLRNAVAEVIPFTVETADRYARIRGTLAISPADAIHLASAAQAGTEPAAAVGGGGSAPSPARRLLRVNNGLAGVMEFVTQPGPPPNCRWVRFNAVCSASRPMLLSQLGPASSKAQSGWSRWHLPASRRRTS